MGLLKNVGTRLEKFDDGLEAARDSLTTQAALNVALAVGVGFAILVAVVALVRGSHE